MFRKFDDNTIKSGKELNFVFNPFKSWIWDEYFWLKIWYKNYYLKIIAFGKERGFNNFIYKIRKDGISFKSIGSTEPSKIIAKWNVCK